MTKTPKKIPPSTSENNEHNTNSQVEETIPPSNPSITTESNHHHSTSSSSSSSSSTNIPSNEDDNNGGNPIYLTTPSPNNTTNTTTSSSSWELTWPIWHMLPHTERKRIAKEHGFTSIGDFEESMTLSRALRVDDSDHGGGGGGGGGGGEGAPYGRERMEDLEHRPERYGLPTVAERGVVVGRGDDHLDDDEPDDNDDPDEEEEEEEEEDKTNNDPPPSPPSPPHPHPPQTGGPLLLLPPDLLLHSLLPYLPISTIPILASTHPSYHPFTRTPLIHQHLCLRAYCNPSHHPHHTGPADLRLHDNPRWRGEWRRMLERRPRVAGLGGGGLYVLQHTVIKRIQRDMWTEIPVGAVLDCSFFRYLFFREDGLVWYGLSNMAPWEMIPVLVRANARCGGEVEGDCDASRLHRNANSGIPSLQTTTNNTTTTKKKNNNTKKKKKTIRPSHPDPKSRPTTLLGTYTIHRRRVTVTVRQPWHTVRFVLRLLPDGCEGARGKFWGMELLEHLSSRSGDFGDDGGGGGGRDVVRYDVPSEPFRFMRDLRL